MTRILSTQPPPASEASNAGSASASAGRGRDFWLYHAWLPGIAFLGLALGGAFTGMDIALARAWAYDEAAGRFIGTGPGEWWAKTLLHSDGGTAVRLAGVALLLFWLGTRKLPSLAQWRRAAGYAVAAAAAGAAVVGLLKATTNVDCPRVLDLFGGARPYIHLFGDRPDYLDRARCFPGGHSSSGFAFFALYFALRERYLDWARISLGLALGIGTLFAFGQEARGAHFLSHDIWSAALSWFSCLAIYAGCYKGRLWATHT